MRTTAAVALEAGKPLEIMDVEMGGPREGEVLVEIKATGLCHTDEFTRSGDDPEGIFPAILGHEGAGVVVEVGMGVNSLAVGDHVIPLYTPECRECEYCLNPKTNLCQSIRATQGQGLLPDGSTRFSMLDGTPIHHYMGCSTFANHTIVPEIALAKVRKDAPFDKICYIGCGVTTGIGAVINTAKVEIGSRAIVFGLGGIGLNVIQGLRLAGADLVGDGVVGARGAVAGSDAHPESDPSAAEHGRAHRHADDGRPPAEHEDRAGTVAVASPDVEHDLAYRAPRVPERTLLPVACLGRSLAGAGDGGCAHRLPAVPGAIVGSSRARRARVASSTELSTG
mgnify:CR=1 FL=1